MSFYVFLREEVDVAIYEVGVGGEYDSTNVVEKPIVTGITALGIAVICGRPSHKAKITNLQTALCSHLL
jgi:hypothetical protein